jgi:FtsH-binding integral membrane protein
MAFGVAAIVFILMSVIGLVTKQDLTKWGPILLFGLIGLILATLVNIFLRSSTLDLIITYIGIILFMGLIVFDTKYIKTMTAKAVSAGANSTAMGGDSAAVGGDVLAKLSVLGALKLYLDFINLFLYLLRLFGRN